MTEREAEDRRNVFDIALLGARMTQAIDWASDDARVLGLPIGLFGASTGAAAAIVAATERPELIGAIVSRGGRPDLAGPALGVLRAPTLLIVGSRDLEVLDLNRAAMKAMRCETSLHVVPGATHLFEEKGTLDQALSAARAWYVRHLRAGRLLFDDREAAGAALASRMSRYASAKPVVYALPRGGVPVALAIARALNAPLDVLLVRKIGVPGNPELAAGAVVEGEPPHFVFNRDVMRMARLSEAEVRERGTAELREIERRQSLYRPGRAAVSATGATAILVDDGIATGASMNAAIAAIRQSRPKQIVVAVPVLSRRSAIELHASVDAIVCLAAPEDFSAVGEFYRDFRQLSDEDVVRSIAGYAPKREGRTGKGGAPGE